MVFQASLRSLRSTFDPDGEKIFLQEGIGHPEYLVTDVSTMDWPEKLELNMSESRWYQYQSVLAEAPTMN